MSFKHKDLARGRWKKLSLTEQLGNIGSEVSRAINWKNRDEKIFWNTVERALELFDLTLDDPRWKGRRREIARAREVFLSAIFDEKIYKTSLSDMLKYFNSFALAARK